MPSNLLLMHNFELENKVKSRHQFPILGQTLLSLRWSENRITTMLYENLNAAHHPKSSLIQANHQRILKNPQNGFLKGSLSKLSLVPTDGAKMKLMKQKFGQWWNSNIYQKFLSRSSTNGLPCSGRTRPRCVEIAAMYGRNPQANDRGKMYRSSWVGVGKRIWRNSVQ